MRLSEHTEDTELDLPEPDDSEPMPLDCPICGSQNVRLEDGLFECFNCDWWDIVEEPKDDCPY